MTPSDNVYDGNPRFKSYILVSSLYILESQEHVHEALLTQATFLPSTLYKCCSLPVADNDGVTF